MFLYLPTFIYLLIRYFVSKRSILLAAFLFSEVSYSGSSDADANVPSSDTSTFVSILPEDDNLQNTPLVQSEAQITDTREVTMTELLGNVVNANRYYSYDGLLTYEANGSLSTLKLQQRVDADSNDHRIYQTLEFLDGMSRRVIRDQPLKNCAAGNTRWGLWPHTFDTDRLKQFYQTVFLGSERIANRATYALVLLPKDEFRYAYQFNIDQLTGLLLRTVIMEKNNIIERTQFVSIDLSAQIDEVVNESEDNILWRVPQVEPCHTEHFQSAWYVSWLPDGFEPVGNRVTAHGEQVLMFSDGLVSVSVFITSSELDNIPKVTARRGATVTVMSVLSAPSLGGAEGKAVAVVGEIPIVAARRIAVSVKSR